METKNLSSIANVQSVKEFTERINKGTFGIQFLFITEPSMNKKGNPFYGRLKKVTYISNVALGYDYENVVNARLAKQGLEPCYKAQAPKGLHHISDYMLAKNSDPSVTYLRATMQGSTKEKHSYYLDNIKVTDPTLLAEIKVWITPKTKVAKQSAHGLTENQVVVRNVTTTNVVALKQGAKLYFVENKELDLDEYLSLF